MAQPLAVLLMLERWIEPAVSHMEPEFTTHDYIEKLRELYPADYAHDLALCTLERGFPQSLAVLHKHISDSLRKSGRVEAIGTKKNRDIRGNKHRIVVWRRRQARKGIPRTPPPPLMTGSQLQATRLTRGWTQTELARRAGVSLASVSRWERDERRMGWSTYQAVQKAFQVASLHQKARSAKPRQQRRKL